MLGESPRAPRQRVPARKGRAPARPCRPPGPAAPGGGAASHNHSYVAGRGAVPLGAPPARQHNGAYSRADVLTPHPTLPPKRPSPGVERCLHEHAAVQQSTSMPKPRGALLSSSPCITMCCGRRVHRLHRPASQREWNDDYDSSTDLFRGGQVAPSGRQCIMHHSDHSVAERTCPPPRRAAAAVGSLAAFLTLALCLVPAGFSTRLNASRPRPRLTSCVRATHTTILLSRLPCGAVPHHYLCLPDV